MSRLLELFAAAHGQCRLSYVSATQIKLSQFGGSNIAINGRLKKVPAAGVTAANTTGALSYVDERFVSEGYHFGSMTGNCAGGTSVLYLGGQNGEVSHLLTVMG